MRVSVLALVVLTLTAPQAPGLVESLGEYVTLFAGPGAIDCGNAGSPGELTRMVDCGLAAAKRSQAFLIQQREWHIEGFLGNSSGAIYHYRIQESCSGATRSPAAAGPPRFEIARCPSPSVSRGLTVCYDRRDVVPLQKPEEYLDLVAGPRATDCGRLGIRATEPDLRRSLDCALAASGKREAFYAIKQYQGIDSSIYSGLIGDRTGRLFYFDYDDAPCGSPACYGQFALKRCPAPTVATTENRAVFVCTQAAPAAEQPYTTVFYPSGSLRIEAYLYRPTGTGPFPVVVYSHGSRKGYEREERPMAFVGNMLASQGYLVLVPERRGYGKSDGRTFTEEVGSDVGDKMIRRLEAEGDDVVAAITYAAAIDGADLSRLALVGFSQGGSVSIRAASKRPDVRALVDQAGGALTWPRSPDLRRVLADWAKTLKMPVLCMDAANDATTDAVKAVCDAAHRAGAETHVTIYPAFTPASNPENIAPGHLIFAPGAGVAIWRQDLISFLAAKTARGRVLSAGF